MIDNNVYFWVGNIVESASVQHRTFNTYQESECDIHNKNSPR